MGYHYEDPYQQDGRHGGGDYGHGGHVCGCRRRRCCRPCCRPRCCFNPCWFFCCGGCRRRYY